MHPIAEEAEEAGFVGLGRGLMLDKRQDGGVETSLGRDGCGRMG